MSSLQRNWNHSSVRIWLKYRENNRLEIMVLSSFDKLLHCTNMVLLSTIFRGKIGVVTNNTFLHSLSAVIVVFARPIFFSFSAKLREEKFLICCLFLLNI
jgi:hypothetical protein